MLSHENNASVDYDVVLIGAGIMSATLAVFLKELQPDLEIAIFERLDRVAAESSDAWNNAGTGHSALCELNYTPQREDGSIDITKALKIIESFEVSKQFWSYLVGHGYFSSPKSFINSIPHMSFVWGEEDVDYLRKRHEALQTSHLFKGMEFSDQPEILASWMPLVMQHRSGSEKIAATRIELGTDVNFGELTRSLFNHLKEGHAIEVFLNHEVKSLEQDEMRHWFVKVEDETNDINKTVQAKFVFIGAGGGALRLLEKSDIQEGEGFGGFPVSGQWLVCKNETLIAQHHAKVYGKAKVGAPPMSVPHLDTRIIDGKKELLFGPFAGFSTKFLKQGSFFDLAFSLTPHNILPMLSAGIHNLPLTKYLIEQVMLSFEDKIEALREFIPNATESDWELAVAGQRVQVIKKDEEEGGVLEFGTEVIASADGTLAALLGASPGASTSVSIMLELLHKCFKDQMASEAWTTKLNEMIPSYGKHLADDPELTHRVRKWTHEVLQLNHINIL
ncbi:malate dehydrogenase (quinone) [Runella salmonicolor]|uniref:Probable malate:quinone oxidoreductase n=1 Tax=Runella salmonicolor TaxID=2950278 RepID=A0ABT1FKP0_9BACT|nr:malate dehydrogenase (quinone) [Runella salmonicolor]MCP1382330.1 malate dehydrogenase (quinone) [Runella salmonicolor]